MPRFASKQCLGGLLQTQCIEWFDDPAFSTTASREVHICMTIEKHQHRDVWDALVAVIEAQIHRDGHCTHRSELQVQNGEIGNTTFDGLGNVSTVRADHERVLRGAEGSDDLIQYPLRVRTHENVHVFRLLQRRQ